MFSTGLEFALKCIRNKSYEGIEEACKEEMNKTDNSLVRRTLALNLLGTFIILRGNYDAGLEHLTTVIETPGVPNKVKHFILFCARYLSRSLKFCICTKSFLFYTYFK